MVTITNSRPANRRKLLLRVSIAVGLLGLVSSAFGQAVDAWDTRHPPGVRFTVLAGAAGFAGLAVRDNETGLVWEQSPNGGAFTWDGAETHCNTLVVANRLGWRLPTLQELTSVLPVSQPPFVLPFGVGEHIWSATSQYLC